MRGHKGRERKKVALVLTWPGQLRGSGGLRILLTGNGCTYD
jgi:hypothetical protein